MHPFTILSFQLQPENLVEGGYFLQDGQGKPLPLRYEPMSRGVQYIEVWKRSSIKRPRRKARFKLVVKVPDDNFAVDDVAYQNMLQESVAMAEENKIRLAIRMSQMNNQVPKVMPSVQPAHMSQIEFNWADDQPPPPTRDPAPPAQRQVSAAPLLQSPIVPDPPRSAQWVGRDWQVGDRVEAQRMGQWVPAAITEMNENNMAIRYDQDPTKTNGYLELPILSGRGKVLY